MNREMQFTQLFSAYPNSQASATTVAVYAKLLRDIPDEQLQVVIDQAIAECKFLPTVAELRDRWHALTQPMIGTAGEAWAQVLSEIRRVGSWGKPTFDDPMIERAVQAVGWLDICQSENIGVVRAHFLKAYDQMAARDNQVQRLLPHARRMAEQHRALPSDMSHIAAYLPARNGDNDD